MEIGKAQPILKIENLTIAYQHDRGWLPAVREFSLEINAGQTIGLVGESGSGKSTIALALMRYLGEGGAVQQGTIWFNGRDLLTLSQTEMRQIWGKQITMVPQDPMSSLNPSLKIQEQVAEPLQHHMGLNKAAAIRRAVGLLEMVRVPDPTRTAQSYPHQISGGMQQRVMVAMALSTEPDLLVLDEPTTNLDVTTQAAVLDLFRDLIDERQTAVLYVTHNLGVVARVCDRVSVLYAGELVEEADTDTLFKRPVHPYTVGLLQSVPQIGQNKEGISLQAIPGQIPTLGQRPAGCIFAPRCLVAVDQCHEKRPLLEPPSANSLVRCHRWPEIAKGTLSAQQEASKVSPNGRTAEERIVLSLENVQVYFDINRSFMDALKQQPAAQVRAVDGISLQMSTGETLGVVGESGSGKTTLARAIIGLAERTGGEIELLDSPLPAALADRDPKMMRHLQYVFQNPEEALNPYLTVGETLQRPFITLLGLSKTDAQEQVDALLTSVRLPTGYAQRLPSQLSGGEKQRVAIARAFATNPDLLIADEAVSALDVSVQASILNLLRDLQADTQHALLFISHDLAVVGYLADSIAVVYVGQLMELADARQLFQPPYHPYTEALLSAIPHPDPNVQQTPIHLQGDVPSQIEMPTGCPFHPRCPRYLGDICRDETPPWQTAVTGKRIFCHIPLAELADKQKQKE